MNLLPTLNFRTMYTVTEFAKAAGVTRDVVKGWMRAGELVRDVPGKYCISIEQANKVLSRQRTKGIKSA